MAIAEAEAGPTFLDVNIGPARKGGAEMMEWLVKTIHEVVDLPLSLDTTNLEAMEAGLKAHKKGKLWYVRIRDMQKYMEKTAKGKQ